MFPWIDVMSHCEVAAIVFLRVWYHFHIRRRRLHLFINFIIYTFWFLFIPSFWTNDSMINTKRSAASALTLRFGVLYLVYTIILVTLLSVYRQPTVAVLLLTLAIYYIHDENGRALHSRINECPAFENTTVTGVPISGRAQRRISHRSSRDRQW